MDNHNSRNIEALILRHCLAAVFLLCSQQTEAQVMDGGTLVVMIPTKDGLIAASDSRLTLDDTYCDGVEKFIELKTPDRTLMVVTGRRGFWPR